MAKEPVETPAEEPKAPPTEREKYIAGIEDKLRKAGKAKRFMEGEDGSLVTDWLREQVNGFVKNLGGTKYLDNNNLANYDRGQLAMAQKLLTMLNGHVNANTGELKELLDAAKSDQ